MWSTKAVVLGLLLIALTACERNHVAAEAGAKPGGAPSLQQRANADEPLLVVIEPAQPTVETDLTASANDASVAYLWSVNGGPVPGGDGRNLPKTMFRRSDTVTVDVTLNTQHAHAQVTIQNSPPRATEVSLDQPIEVLHQGMILTALPKGFDADGDDIQWEYQWIRDEEPIPGATSAVLAGDQYHRGDRLTVRVTPSDGDATGEPYTPGAVTIPNGLPEFVSHPPGVTGSAEYVYQVQAVDPDGDPVRYRLVKAPGGMTLDGQTGMVKWSLVGASPGRQSVEIEADDGAGGTAQQPFELDISPPEG